MVLILYPYDLFQRTPCCVPESVTPPIPHSRLPDREAHLPRRREEPEDAPPVLTKYSFYYHKDHLGSSTVMTDSSGVGTYGTSAYEPFGSMRSTTGQSGSSYKFTDQELDSESGLYNYNARLYDPEIGRFISADPIVPDPFNPQSLNRYSYVLNNPLIYTDPSGYWAAAPGQDEEYDCTEEGECTYKETTFTDTMESAPGSSDTNTGRPFSPPGPDMNDIRRAQGSFAYGTSLAERLNSNSSSSTGPSAGNASSTGAPAGNVLATGTGSGGASGGSNSDQPLSLKATLREWFSKPNLFAQQLDVATQGIPIVTPFFDVAGLITTQADIVLSDASLVNKVRATAINMAGAFMAFNIIPTPVNVCGGAALDSLSYISIGELLKPQ